MAAYTGATSVNTQTFRSKMGSFVFDKGVPLVSAKLIRDSVTGQYFKPLPGEPRIKTAEDAEAYVRNNLPKSLCDIPVEIQVDPR